LRIHIGTRQWHKSKDIAPFGSQKDTTFDEKAHEDTAA
jgi:hypothetical protein